jgi:hypothetical protein
VKGIIWAAALQTLCISLGYVVVMWLGNTTGIIDTWILWYPMLVLAGLSSLLLVQLERRSYQDQMSANQRQRLRQSISPRLRMPTSSRSTRGTPDGWSE